MASTVAITKATKATRSAQPPPPSFEAMPARPPTMAPPITPESEIRELAFTSVRPSGSSRGMVAARATPYALEETRQPSAAG